MSVLYSLIAYTFFCILYFFFKEPYLKPKLIWEGHFATIWVAIKGNKNTLDIL